MTVSFGDEALDRIGAAHIEISSRRSCDLADIVAPQRRSASESVPRPSADDRVRFSALGRTASSASLIDAAKPSRFRRLVELAVGATRWVRSSSTS
jgi:hypothetical protein